MPQESQTENITAETPEVESTTTEVIATPIEGEVTPAKKPFYKRFRFYLYLFFVILTVVIILWLANVFMVYRQASVYKKTYDQVQTEKTFCDSIQGTSQSKDVFDYCDRFQSKFKDLETTK